MATRCLVSLPPTEAKLPLLHKLVGKRSLPYDDDTSSTSLMKENEPTNDGREATGRSHGVTRIDERGAKVDPIFYG